MGWAAGRKLRRSVDGATRVLAIELLASTRALDFRRAAEPELAPAPATAAVHALFRSRIPGPGTDEFLSPAIDAAVAFVRDGAVLAAASAAIGELQ